MTPSPSFLSPFIVIKFSSITIRVDSVGPRPIASDHNIRRILPPSALFGNPF